MGFGDGGFLLGGIPFGGDGGLSRRTVRHRGRYAIKNIIEPSDREAFGKAQRAQEAIPGLIRGGYAQARRSVGGAFRGAQRAAVEQGQLAEGDALQRMANAGYSGASSIAGNLRAGIGYGTARAIQDIQDRIAQIGSSLDIGEAQELVGAQSELSDFYMRRGHADRQRNLLEYNLLTGAQAQPSPYAPANLDDLVKLIASLSGAG